MPWCKWCNVITRQSTIKYYHIIKDSFTSKIVYKSSKLLKAIYFIFRNNKRLRFICGYTFLKWKMTKIMCNKYPRRLFCLSPCSFRMTLIFPCICSTLGLQIFFSDIGLARDVGFLEILLLLWLNVNVSLECNFN